MKAATFSSGGGSQSSLGSRVSFQCSQICAGLVGQQVDLGKAVRAGEPECTLADQQAMPGALHHHRATAAGCMMLRIEATEPPPWVGPCMTAASSSTTPSSLGSPP